MAARSGVCTSIPTDDSGREIDLMPVFYFVAPNACQAAKMVDHEDFVFNMVPAGNDLSEVADKEPASEYLFEKAATATAGSKV